MNILLVFLLLSTTIKIVVNGQLMGVQERCQRQASVLVTGFLPFLDYDDNPSGDVASMINGSCLKFPFIERTGPSCIDVCFDGWILPVNTSGSSMVANILNSGESFGYDSILHLGLESAAKGLKLETFASNQLAEVTESTDITTFCLNNSNFAQPTGSYLLTVITSLFSNT
jgi:hypothetical protein